MKRKLIKLLIVGAVIAFVGSSVPVQALPFITGQISLGGTCTSDNSDLTLATTFSSFTGVTVGGGATGTYAGLGGSAATMASSIIFRPITVPISPLWTIAGGYDFNLTSMFIGPGNDANDLTLKGSGILQAPGFADTVGTWILTAQTFGATTFTFSSSNGAAVPDGGTTVLLLGAALSTLALIKRRLA